MLLGRLLAAVESYRFSGDDVDITDIAYDSRAVRPGALFVAVPSVGGDVSGGGNRFVLDAVRRGAAAVVTAVEPQIDGVSTVVVPNTRTALADLSAAFFGHPSRELRLFAVTGTDGKTTTASMLEQILATAGHCTGLIGTIETKIGDRRNRNQDRVTTPESLDIQRLLRSMVDAGVTHVALEASSHALALDRLRGCSLAACALTNITADHVEFHGSWNEYFRAKSRLFTEIGAGRPAILNMDDPSCDRLAEMISGPIVRYGLSTGADICGIFVRREPHGTCFRLCYRDSERELVLPLPGQYNISNALAAAGMALTDGVSLETVVLALSSVHAPPGRMQRVDLGQPFEIVVDYAHTVHAFRSTLSALRERVEPPHRLIAVFGAAGNRDRQKRPVLAQTARQYADYFVITNEDPFGEEAGAIVEQIAGGVPREEEGSRYERQLDRSRAIGRAIELARPGDTVVILGKGHEQSIVVSGRKEPWSDVGAVEAALAGVS